jgi:hypothetical protein
VSRRSRTWADDRTRTDVVPSLVDKALGSVRAGTKKKGVELCCMYVEVENAGEGVVVSFFSTSAQNES